jgi:hypothetical protein
MTGVSDLPNLGGPTETYSGICLRAIVLYVLVLNGMYVLQDRGTWLRLRWAFRQWQRQATAGILDRHAGMRGAYLDARRLTCKAWGAWADYVHVRRWKSAAHARADLRFRRGCLKRAYAGWIEVRAEGVCREHVAPMHWLEGKLRR